MDTYYKQMKAERDMLFEALSTLVQVKENKENFGKDQWYQINQPKAWDLAYETLEKIKRQDKEISYTGQATVMQEKEKGLYEKYEVTKLTNPNKELDCVVLEFDDPVQRKGIRAFAEAAADEGYHRLAWDLDRKCDAYEDAEE